MTPNTDNTNSTPLPARLRWLRADDDVLEGPRDEIMRQYAESGFDGRLVPIDVAQVPAPQPRPVTLRPGVDVDPEAQARAGVAR